MSESKEQLYKVKLAPGFNAKGRQRAGVSVQKGVTEVLALSKEQLAALEEDVWFVVTKADGDAEATQETTQTTDEVTDPYEGVSFKDLKAQATEAGLDIKGLKSRADVIAVLEAASDEEETEEVELSEDMSLEDLKTIATDQGVAPEVVEAAGEEDKAELIKAIEEASDKTEE